MAYRPDRRTIGVDEARAIIAVHGEPVTGAETVALDDADGRVLATDVVSGLDVPSFARSAMDGYAVRAADTRGASRDAPVRLMLIETIYTGTMPSKTVESGACSAIATGAPLPPGADAVVVVERSAREDGSVLIQEEVAPGQHVRRAGSDLVAGETALRSGAVLTPARVAVLAAVGRTHVEVFRRPRVAILSTGDEIVAPGERLQPGQIYDSNTTALAAAVRAHGGEAVVAPRTRDDRDELRRAFERCLDADLVLFSGGTSVGERDYILEIIGELGQVRFEGLRLKPGKPTVFAEVRGVPVFGMPGNPVSCLTNMYLLVAPLLRRLAHLPPPVQRVAVARLAEAVQSPPGRHQIYPVRLEGDRAVPVFKGSGEVTSLAWADGYFEIAEQVESVEAGTVVEVTLF